MRARTKERRTTPRTDGSNHEARTKVPCAPPQKKGQQLPSLIRCLRASLSPLLSPSRMKIDRASEKAAFASFNMPRDSLIVPSNPSDSAIPDRFFNFLDGDWPKQSNEDCS